MAAVPQQQQQIDRTEEINNAFGAAARNIRSITRTCDLRAILRPEYQHLRPILINIAEQHNILQRDAYNLMNLHVRRFLCAIGDDAIRVNAEDDNWGPNFATTQGGGIPPTPGGQQVMPGQGLVIPPVTNQTLWSWAYKLVSNSPMMENVNIGARTAAVNDLLNTYVNHFQPLQRNELGNESLYEPPNMFQRILSVQSERFAKQAVTNVKNMLWRNIPGYMRRVCDGYIRHLDQLSEANFDIYHHFKRLAPIIVTNVIHHEEATPEELLPVNVQHSDLFYWLYREMHVVFEHHLANEDLDAMQHTPSKGLTPVLAIRLIRYSFWLLHQAQELNIAGWSLLPMGQLQVGFFGVDMRMLWAILHYARDQDEDAALPPICLDQRGRVLGRDPFEANFNTQRQKELLWEALLDINHVQRRRWRYSGELPGTAIRFAHFIKTDGFTAKCLFERPSNRGQAPFYPEIAQTSRRDIPRDVDLTNIHSGIYYLNKIPQGLTQERLNGSRIVGVDPGKREFITCIDHEESLQDRPRNQVVEIPARHYQHATMTHWIARRTQANRLKANMQEVYDEMAVDHALVPRFVQLKAYITCISRNSDRLRDFGSHFKHRSTRGILFSARQSYQQVIMNEILGVSPPDSPKEKVMFINKTSKSKRKGVRKFRRQQLQWERPQQPTIIAYGDASIGHMRTFAPLPHWHFVKRLSRLALVVFIDEFKTSITCKQGDGNLLLCYDNTQLHCHHSKKRYRVQTAQGNRGRKVRHCLDDQGIAIGRSNLCQHRAPADFNHWRNKLYPVKLCQAHGFLGRDVNAAAQMRMILRLYMETNGDIESRPANLRR